MKLVIAEKPSVAMSLAAVLGATERKDGYLEGSGYLVSWCVGHLLELAQPEAYKEQYAKWRYEDLPILPENWKYEVPKDKKKQLALLCRLMKDKRVDSVVCATDAGREGELIFRLVYEYAGCNKPMERLWISSMEDAAIREGFDHLRPGSDYDKLYDAAVCRAGADWLIGINATRLFSVLYGVTLNVGRVMSPTLALLVQRESDIESFISKPFYVPEITCGGFTASGEKMTERSEAEKIRMDCDHNSAFVRSAEKQVKTIQPPRLYDLTTLQRECNRIYGYTAQQTLDYVQSLYEKKLATYPRTDSQYLTKDMQATAASLILWLRDNMPFGKGCAGEPDIDRVTDDSKVTDHHAIIPTVEIARTDLSELPSGERDVLTLLAVRLLCATTQVHRFEAVTAILDCQGYTFTAKGKTILQSGWKEVERIHRSECYSRDMSMKTKSAKYAKMRRGEYQSVICPYGYRKSADGRMEPDEDVAPNVQMIFQWASEGNTAAEITRKLYAMNIPTPGEYRKLKGKDYYNVSRTNGVWSTSTVLRILEDQRYIGTYVIGKRKVKEIGSRHTQLKDESEWFKIPNHHPAIVSVDLFEKANASIKRFSLSNKKPRDYLLRGKVFCGCCDHAMSLRNGAWFYCRHSEVAETLPCHGVRIKMADLEQVVFETIRAQMCPALGIDSNKDKLDLQTVQQAEHEEKLRSIQDSKRHLYEQYALGEIDLETYRTRKAVYDTELVQAKNVHAVITAQTKQIKSDYEIKLKQQEIVQEVGNANMLTKALIDRLINKVYVFPGDRIEIEYATQDFLETKQSEKEV